MKRLISYILCLLIVIMTITGCSHNKNKFSYEDAIKKIISPSTYTEMNTDDLEEYQKYCEKTFKDYFNNEALDGLAAGQVFVMYKNFFEENKVKSIKDIKITEKENKKINEGTYIECEVSYLCETNDDSIGMKDYYIINLTKDGDKTIVSKINPRETSSIYEYMKKNKVKSI